MKIKVYRRKDLISVILPFYGDFDPKRVSIAIDSIKYQRNVNVEIVVSETGEFPRLKNSLDSSVKYTFRRYDPSSRLGYFSPGFNRNLAVSASRGKFLYTNDADIIFLSPYYLERAMALLNSEPELILFRPVKRRLPQENFEELREWVDSMGIKKALNSLNFGQQYLATTDGKSRNFEIMIRYENKYEKTFTKESIVWIEDRHTGGIFMRREQFDLVGGYCGEFLNWGCEDSDLQWKLSKIFKLQLFPKKPFMEVLHLDHPRDYISLEMWAQNRKVRDKRISEGARKAIISDRRTNIEARQ